MILRNGLRSHRHTIVDQRKRGRRKSSLCALNSLGSHPAWSPSSWRLFAGQKSSAAQARAPNRSMWITSQPSRRWRASMTFLRCSASSRDVELRKTLRICSMPSGNNSEFQFYPVGGVRGAMGTEKTAAQACATRLPTMTEWRSLPDDTWPVTGVPGSVSCSCTFSRGATRSRRTQ